jgi:hypothetical protein
VIARNSESFGALVALLSVMRLRLLRSPIRHPFYPGLAVTLAVECKGPCAGLSGTLRELTRAATAGARVRRMIFALHYPGTPFLNQTQRDQLWQMFQVPVLAVLLDRNGRLLAYECEAQSGLHVGPQAPWSAGVLESAPCECGRPGLRLQLAAREPFCAVQTAAPSAFSAAERLSPAALNP